MQETELYIATIKMLEGKGNQILKCSIYYILIILKSNHIQLFQIEKEYQEYNFFNV